MIQLKWAAVAAFALMGSASLPHSTSAQQMGAEGAGSQPLSTRWQALAQKTSAKSKPGPQLVGKTLTITCKVTPQSSSPTGVILAQGGNQRGYALYLKAGKPLFSVRQQGKLYTAKAASSPKGSFAVEAHLRKDGAMTLAINGSIVARGKAPGVFVLQPKDGFSVSQDSLSAVGDYQAPNPLKGKVENVKVLAQ